MFCRIPQMAERGKVVGIFTCGDSRSIVLNYLLEAYLFREHTIGHVVLVSSLMDGGERVEEFILAMIGVWPRMTKFGLADDKGRAADYENLRAKVEKSYLHVIDSPQVNLDTLQDDLNACDSLRFPPKVIIIDSLYGCVCGSTPAGALGWSVVGRRLKVLARFFACPVVVFCESSNIHSPDISHEGYGSLFSNANFDICWWFKRSRQPSNKGDPFRRIYAIEILAGAEAVYADDEDLFFADDIRLLDLDPPDENHESIEDYADELED